MKAKFIYALLATSIIASVCGQQKVLSLYDFANCSTKDVYGKLPDLSNRMILQCDCGVDNQAAIMSGNGFEFSLAMDSFFREDFTLCFDVLIENSTGDVDLFSKAHQCNADTILDIRYRTRDSTFIVFLKEGIDESYLFFGKSDPKSCWQSICLSLIGENVILYINGKEAASIIISDKLRLDNSAPLSFNGSLCQVNNILTPFQGRIDRVLLANYGLTRSEVQAQYIPQHKIITPDTIIFLGDQFNLRSVNNCLGVSWSPATGLSSTSVLDPVASPTVDTRYVAQFNLNQCKINDSVLIRVVDKDKLQCDKIILPSAFTPNGDNLNEEFYISNPYLISKLNYFDILDRNGALIFSTNDPLGRWDGTFKSQILNPGTFYYRIEYECKDETYRNRGSFMLMR